MSFLITYLIVWAAIGAGIGTLIGRSKGRGPAGFWLGLLLGWLGWIVIGVMSRTAEAEARHHIAVAAASQRLSGATERVTGTPRPTPPPSSQSKRATNNALTQVRSQANGAPDPGALHAAIDRFARDKQPQRMLSDWFFATGAFQFVARYDGNLYACNQSMTRPLATSAKAPTASYTKDADGNIVTAIIDGAIFERPHPGLNITRVLESLRATRMDAVPPTSSGAATTLPAPTVGTSSAAMSADAMRTLRTLLDDGLIDQDEYDRKRREIIDRI